MEDNKLLMDENKVLKEELNQLQLIEAQKPITNNYNFNINIIIKKLHTLEYGPKSKIRRDIRKLIKNKIIEKYLNNIGDPYVNNEDVKDVCNNGQLIAKDLEKIFSDYLLNPVEPKLICTDPARRKFIYKNKEGRAEMDMGFEEGVSCYKASLIQTMCDLEFKDKLITDDESRTLGQLVDKDYKLTRLINKMAAGGNILYKDLLEKEKEKSNDDSDVPSQKVEITI